MQPKAWLLALVAGTGVGAGLGFVWLASPSVDARAPSPEGETTATQAATAPQQAARARPPSARAVLTPLFDTLDCEQQGVIDTGQVDDHFGQLFAPRDLDRSHRLSRSEFVRLMPGVPPTSRVAAFELADADGDGEVSANEYRRYLYALIDSADTSKDGEVTRAELRTFSDQPGPPPDR